VAHCIRCGLSEEIFISTGKFGCGSCHKVLFSGNLSRLGNKNRDANIDLINDLESIRRAIHSPAYRLRIARCLRKGFFPHYTSQVEEIRSLLSRLEIPFHDTKNESLELNIGEKFYFGEEDHLRYEWKSNEPSIFLQNKIWNSHFLRFLFLKQLWAWEKNIGFINSCPTNCGRGDRLSVQFRIPKTTFFDLIRQLSPFLGFGIDFLPKLESEVGKILDSDLILVQISCKNAVPRQKLRFFKILGLLGLG
jgi:hypothetical protein